MDTATSVSLLQRLRQPSNLAAWTRFVDLYTPLMYYWARRFGVEANEAGDLVQEVFAILVQKLPEFNYDPKQSFRSWLRTVTLNKWREMLRRRASQPLPGGQPDLEPANDNHANDFVEAEYRQYLINRALKVMQADFQPPTWKAFWECTAQGRAAGEVAKELGITVKAVYQAKARVLRRLRQELDGLLE